MTKEKLYKIKKDLDFRISFAIKSIGESLKDLDKGQKTELEAHIGSYDKKEGGFVWMLSDLWGVYGCLEREEQLEVWADCSRTADRVKEIEKVLGYKK